MTRSMALKATALAYATLLAGVSSAAAHDISAVLSGFEEVPALSTPAKGTIDLELKNNAIKYKLTYANLGSNVLQAHIHFAQRGVNGGISMFLCSNLGNGPLGTPACPGTTSGVVTGTVVAAGVVGGAAAQGIAAGELAELLRAIRAGVGYANVHTTGFPGGEIRGQIPADNEGDDD